MRKQCFEWVRKVAMDIGLDGNLGDRLRKVAYTLQTIHHEHFNWALLRQTLRMLRKRVLGQSLDIWMLR